MKETLILDQWHTGPLVSDQLFMSKLAKSYGHVISSVLHRANPLCSLFPLLFSFADFCPLTFTLQSPLLGLSNHTLLSFPQASWCMCAWEIQLWSHAKKRYTATVQSAFLSWPAYTIYGSQLLSHNNSSNNHLSVPCSPKLLPIAMYGLLYSCHYHHCSKKGGC